MVADPKHEPVVQVKLRDRANTFWFRSCDSLSGLRTFRMRFCVGETSYSILNYGVENLGQKVHLRDLPSHVDWDRTRTRSSRGKYVS